MISGTGLAPPGASNIDGTYLITELENLPASPFTITAWSDGPSEGLILVTCNTTGAMEVGDSVTIAGTSDAGGIDINGVKLVTEIVSITQFIIASPTYQRYAARSIFNNILSQLVIGTYGSVPGGIGGMSAGVPIILDKSNCVPSRDGPASVIAVGVGDFSITGAVISTVGTFGVYYRRFLGSTGTGNVYPAQDTDKFKITATVFTPGTTGSVVNNPVHIGDVSSTNLLTPTVTSNISSDAFTLSNLHVGDNPNPSGLLNFNEGYGILSDGDILNRGILEQVGTAYFTNGIQATGFTNISGNVSLGGTMALAGARLTISTGSFNTYTGLASTTCGEFSVTSGAGVDLRSFTTGANIGMSLPLMLGCELNLGPLSSKLESGVFTPSIGVAPLFGGRELTIIGTGGINLYSSRGDCKFGAVFGNMITTVNLGSSVHNIAGAFNVSSAELNLNCSNQALLYSSSASTKINAWNQVLIESGVGITHPLSAHVIVNSLHKTKINATTGFEVLSNAGLSTN